MYSSPGSTPADLHSFLYMLTPTGQGVQNLLCGGLPKASTGLHEPRLGYFLPPLTYRVPQYIPTAFPRNVHIQLPHLRTPLSTADTPPLVPLVPPEHINNHWVLTWVIITKQPKTVHTWEPTHNGFSSVHSTWYQCRHPCTHRDPLWWTDLALFLTLWETEDQCTTLGANCCKGVVFETIKSIVHPQDTSLQHVSN